MARGGKRVVTVKGEISPHDLGITLPHEHLLVDLSFYADFYRGHGLLRRKSVDQPVSLENLWVARRDLFSFKDNLIVDDEGLLVDELRHYREMDGRSIVDLTPPSLGGDPVKVKAISGRTGLNIVYGCGFYIEPSHPKYVSRKSTQGLADELVALIERGYGATGIRAGILGEIGTSPTITVQERKVLLAVANAHVRTGAPINIHLANMRGKNGPGVVRLMKDHGVKMDKLVLSHVDMKYKDIDHQIMLAESGSFIEFDGFGLEDYVERLDFLPPRDRERIENLLFLIDKGFIDQLLISQDNCRKTALGKYGGPGFAHILGNVAPMMKKAGMTNREIKKMMVSNPARLLAF